MFIIIINIIIWMEVPSVVRFKWTEEKIELLRKYYPNTSWEELFSILGTTKKIIYNVDGLYVSY